MSLINPIHYYNLNESSGTAAAIDTGTTAVNLTNVVGTPTVLSGVCPGYGRGFSYSSLSTLAQGAQDASMTLGKSYDYTVSFWLRYLSGNLPPGQYIDIVIRPNAFTVNLAATGDSIACKGYYNTGATFSPGSTNGKGNGQWHHVVVQVDGSTTNGTMYFWVDGTLIVSYSPTSYPMHNGDVTQMTQIGGSVVEIDELSIFRTSVGGGGLLTSGQIALLYNSGMGQFWNGSSWSAASGIQRIASTSAGGTSSSVTTTGINTTGASLLVVQIVYYQSGGSIVPGTNFTDTYSNSWNLIKNETPSGGGGSSFYYCSNPIVGTGHTFSVSGSSLYPCISVAAYSGVSTTSPLDQSSGANIAGSGTSLQPGSVTPNQNNELIVAGLAIGSTTTTTTVSPPFFAPLAVSGAAFAVDISDLVQPTAAAVNPTWTFTGGSFGSSASIATFKQAPTAPTTATITAPSPASSDMGVSSGAFTVTLNNVAPSGGQVISLASSVSGDTFTATSGGASVTSITIASGVTTGNFYFVPGATSVAGSRTITPTSSGITFSPTTSPYTGIDITAPTVASASINASGTTLTISFTETGSPPVLPASGATGFTITPSGGATTLSSPSISGTTYTATTSRTITQNETITLAYSPGNITDSATSPNSLAAFSGQTVSNNSTQVAPLVAGTLTTGTVAYNSVTMTITGNTGGVGTLSNQLWRSLHSAGSYSAVGSAVTGTTATLTDNTVSPSTAYDYKVVVTDSATPTPNTATSNIVSNVTTQYTPLAAGTATFISTGPATTGISVSATAATNGSGSGPTYQWQRNTDSGTYSNLSGATSLSLTDTTAVSGHLYGYQCVQTRGTDNVTTNAITAQIYNGGSLSGGSTFGSVFGCSFIQGR